MKRVSPLWSRWLTLAASHLITGERFVFSLDLQSLSPWIFQVPVRCVPMSMLMRTPPLR